MVLVLALIDVGRKKKKDGLILVLALVVIDILVGRGGGELRFWCWHLALALNAIDVLALVIRGGGSVMLILIQKIY